MTDSIKAFEESRRALTEISPNQELKDYLIAVSTGDKHAALIAVENLACAAHRGLLPTVSLIEETTDGSIKSQVWSEDYASEVS